MLLGLEKQEVKTKLQTGNIKWDYNIKMDLKEIGFEDVNWAEIV
jgi:hypothetical protein